MSCKGQNLEKENKFIKSRNEIDLTQLMDSKPKQAVLLYAKQSGPNYFGKVKLPHGMVDDGGYPNRMKKFHTMKPQSIKLL